MCQRFRFCGFTDGLTVGDTKNTRVFCKRTGICRISGTRVHKKTIEVCCVASLSSCSTRSYFHGVDCVLDVTDSKEDESVCLEEDITGDVE